MANPTTNYGWPMPTSTDLVTDLPADFDAFGQPVDTTLKALNPETTLGDISYRSAVSNTNTRLGIGTAGQVLAVSGGVPAWTTTADVTPLTTKGDVFTFSTEDARIGVGADGTVLTADSAETTGLKWAAPAGGGMTELASGSMSSTAVSLTSISASYQDLVLIVYTPTWLTANDDLAIRVNNDTGSNYLTSRTTSTSANTFHYISGGSQVYNQANCFYITYFEQYANTTAYKQIHGRTIYRTSTPEWATDNRIGAWLSNSAINRIDILTGAGRTFNGGTYKLFGVK